MVTIRLSRQGAKKNAFYRVVVADSRKPRDGRFLEHVGVYDPNRTPIEVRFDMERIKYWIGTGAIASDTVSQLLKKVEKGLVGKAA